MIGKKTSVKKMFFWLTAGMVLSMTAIILVSFFLTKNIAVLWVGLALTVCAALWMLFMVQLLGMRLSNFTSELCQILDDMMNRSQEPENVSDRETIFARIHHRLVRLYNILQESNRKVEAERQELQSLVSDISHQVRTPVSNMKMIVDTLLTKSLEEQEQNEFLKSVRGQINKLDFLIQALVKTSRLETGTGTPDIANLMAIADLFQISVDELLSNEKSEKKQSNYIYESRTEYDIDGKKNFDIKLGGAYAVDLKAYHGEKIEVAMFSNVYKNLLADYKVKIDDIKNRIDIDLNRFNEASEADAKESLVITIFIPVKYIGKIELSVNAGTLNITDIENEHIEVNGKISEVTLQGNKSEIEMDSNLDMQISVLSHEGALEINQLSATSRLTIPADYRFRSTKKGIATHIYYERQGKKVDDFSDAEADNYIEFNGIKSELVIVEAEV